MVVSFDVDLYYTIGVLTLRLNGCSVTNFHCESGVDFDSPYRYSLRPNGTFYDSMCAFHSAHPV